MGPPFQSLRSPIYVKALMQTSCAWRDRSLEQDYPYLIIDATSLHIRSGGQVATQGVLIVSGIAMSGHRDILAIDVAHKEELMRKRITTFFSIATILLIYPLSLSSQNNFSLSLDANDAVGDQAVTTLSTSPNQVVSIQVFSTNIQNASVLSARFEYDERQVVYEGFDAGDVWPGTPTIFPEQHGTNPTYVEIITGALSGQATVNSGLMGTIRFRTTAAFSGTAIRLVRGELGRGRQLETVTLAARVELQVSTAPSPDFDGDGVVGIPDFLLFVNQFGSSQGDGTYEAKYDLDSNGVIGIPDFLLFINDFGKEVPSTGGGGGGGSGDSSDLIVESPSVSDDTLTPGQSFTLEAMVRNQGNGQSAATTLRYYQSTDATITTSDTSVGTDAVGSLSASGTSSESISLQAPNTPGTYYYGACVESVSGESDTENNCSSGVSVTVASSNTFDATVAQIKNLENQLEENRNRIEQEITQQRQNHPLNAPKDQFESDAQYEARKGQLYGILAESRQRLLVRYGIKDTQIQIAQLYRKIFSTNEITATLGTYNANEEYFPVTFEVILNGKSQRYNKKIWINRDDARSLYNNWDKVVAKGYLSIDPRYRKALAWTGLEYTPIWSKGIWWRFDEVYHLGDNNLSIAFSPDGKYIATGAKNTMATLWDISNGRRIWQKQLGTVVDAVAFSPDGKYLAANGYIRDRTTNYRSFPHVALLGVSSGIIVQREGIQNSSGRYTSQVRSIEFSPDGRYLAIAVDTRWAWLWEWGNGRRRGWGNRSASVTVHATFSPDGRYLATGDNNGHAILWEVSTWWTDVNSQYMGYGVE